MYLTEKEAHEKYCPIRSLQVQQWYPTSNTCPPYALDMTCWGPLCVWWKWVRTLELPEDEWKGTCGMIHKEE